MQMNRNTDGEGEHDVVRVAQNEDGQLIRVTRVNDYFHRGDLLKDVSFYDFIRCFRRMKKQANATAAGANNSFAFKAGHQLQQTHVLVRIGELSYDRKRLGLIPRVFGMSIPKIKSGDDYFLFMLCHFKPFGVDAPLIHSGGTLETEFREFTFSHRARQIMDNWESLNECEDARESDRQKKRDAYAKEGRMHDNLSKASRSIEDSVDEMVNDDCVQQLNKAFETQRLAMSLLEAGWFRASEQTGEERPCRSSPVVPARPSGMIQAFPSNMSFEQMREWRSQIKRTEEAVCRARRQAAVEAVEPQDTVVEESRIRDTQMMGTDPEDVRETVSFASSSVSYSREEFYNKVDEIRQKHALNKMQSVAYNVIANSYIDLQDKRSAALEADHKPLRLFLTGPGGTGKTHIVNCVKEMMGLYNASHRIRFLAPTGSAAALIDGMTIHRGLGISVSSSLETGCTDIFINVKNKSNLRDEWRNVDVVLIDEISMVSLPLFCQLDQAFWYVKEKPHLFFGGMELIVSGDFYQLPPVQGSPLYDCIRVLGRVSDDEIEKRLGALAWHSIDKVIELTEQMRMAGDPEYAAAVLRMRKRQSTQKDVDLFNSRITKGIDDEGLNGEGEVDLSTGEANHATVLVRTNADRNALNMLKARSNCESEESPQLHMCEALDLYADDKRHVANRAPHFDRDYLLGVETGKKGKGNRGGCSLKLPGIIPLYVGMPVIIREKNISTDCGITNGARGTVVHITFKPAEVVGDVNRKVVDVVFVHIPGCRLNLQGLPPQVVPLSSVSSSFRTSPPSIPSNDKIQFIRHQAIVQPAFAITCHCGGGQRLWTLRPVCLCLLCQRQPSAGATCT